ncbi:hypothetical protein AGMMS50268_12750 [Spirochaetia bacterium]|nr:hypothetical protein AGMMS50268_12750 [Spirochaetia bacterium]
MQIILGDFGQPQFIVERCAAYGYEIKLAKKNRSVLSTHLSCVCIYLPFYLTP